MINPEEAGRYGAIILAAGASTRMGSVKQILPWKNTSLLRHAIDQVRLSGFEELAVVLGANREIIENYLALDGVDTVVNDQWEGGMASSLVAGLRHLLAKSTSLQGVLITLSDQPLLKEDDYKKLRISHIENTDKIISSFYANRMGVPALFGRRFFNDLMELKGDQGARMLLRSHGSEVVRVNVGGRGIDLDTREKYEHYYELYGRP
jgi:molybdenum cofactor cytidylyltransferase